MTGITCFSCAETDTGGGIYTAFSGTICNSALLVTNLSVADNSAGMLRMGCCAGEPCDPVFLLSGPPVFVLSSLTQSCNPTDTARGAGGAAFVMVGVVNTSTIVAANITATNNTAGG